MSERRRRPAPGLDPAGAARLAVEGEARIPAELRAAAETLEIDLGEVALGAELAAWQGLRGEEREAFVAIVTALRLAASRGSTRLPLEGASLAGALEELGQGAAGVAAAMALAARLVELREVAGPPEAGRPLVVAGGYLYAGRAFVLEGRVGARVAALASAPAEGTNVAPALEDVWARPPAFRGTELRPSEEQQAAVAAACARRLTVISGGPGTGKTTIVVSVLRALVCLGVEPEDVALAAPTGKAADRMRRAIEAGLAAVPSPEPADRDLAAHLPEAQTLHRLLGWSPGLGRFRHHEGSPLRQRVVVVDEGSMVDLAMFDRLLRALGPEARLVVLGDADQLPSVDAGAVFRDLRSVLSERLPATAPALSRSYRMDPRDPDGRHVLLAARAMNAGDADLLLGEGEAALRRVAPPAARFAGAEHVSAASGAERLALLARWERERVVPPPELTRLEVSSQGGQVDPASEPALRALFAHVEASRILCVTRGRPTGTGALNELFHQRAAARAGVQPGRWLFGEPVLVQRNDYERGLFNGDQGVVLGVREPGQHRRRAAVFRRGDGFVAFPLGPLFAQLELAYAVTVHKAQGSEHDAVLVVLPDAPLPLLSRELLYTGLTRARRGALVMGPEALLREGVRRRATRSSGLAAAVAAQLGSSAGA
ncbi:MAG: exodeoxyribonuclease V subunit alpha [Myxococcota bacterium]